MDAPRRAAHAPARTHAGAASMRPVEVPPMFDLAKIVMSAGGAAAGAVVPF